MSIQTTTLALLSCLGFALPLACNGGGTSREAIGGTQAHSSGEDANATTTESGTASGTGAGTSTNTNVGENGEQGNATLANAKTLEQCTAESKAWRAVVGGGAQPADCTESLVTWCCTRQEVGKRFPTMAADIEAKFAQFIDTEGHVLYHCSQDTATKKTTFHLAKISNGSVSYKTVFVSDVFPVDTGSTGACTAVKTDDLIAAGTAHPITTDTATNTGTTLSFATDIMPILAATCGGSACHVGGGSLAAASQWLDDETKFRASDTKARLGDATRPMPPSTSTQLSAGDKDKLLKFLTP